MDFIPCSIKKLKKLAKRNRVICFGRSLVLKDIFTNQEAIDNLDFIVDNNKGFWGKTHKVGNRDVEIISPARLKEVLTKQHTVMIVIVRYKEVINQIENNLKLSCSNMLFYCSNEEKTALFYKKPFSKFELKNKLVFRSGTGGFNDLDFFDNARALYEYIIKTNLNKKYKIIWMVESPKKYAKKHKRSNVKFVSYKNAESRNLFKQFQYYYHLFTAKFLFTTDTDIWLKNCRDDQVRVNLWHGCGFKDRKIKPICGGRYEYMTVNSYEYAKIHAKAFGCDLSQMLVTGLAKQDLLFRNSKDRIIELMDLNPASKYIVWTPTFRKAVTELSNLDEPMEVSETGFPLVTTKEQLSNLNQYLKAKNIQMLIKTHPVQDISILTRREFSNITLITNNVLIAKDIQVNSFLTVADAMISDYSSIAVDFMLRDKPIAFTLDDVEEYKSSRGFVFDPILDYLPGVLLYSVDDFVSFIDEVSMGLDSSAEKRHALMPVMHRYHNGNNCQRILDTLGITKNC